MNILLCLLILIFEVVTISHVAQPDVKRNEFPYIVSIQTVESGVPVCGGLLINRHFSLTACHCLAFWVPSRRTTAIKRTDDHLVVAGTRYLIPIEEGYQVRRPSSFILHPSCHKSEPLTIWKFDYGFVQAEIPFLYDDSTAPFPLYSKDSTEIKREMDIMVEKETSCFVLSWGAETDTENFHSRQFDLIKKKVKLADDSNCKILLCAFFKEYCVLSGIDSNLVCARETDDSHCSNNDGGPLVCENNVWAVVSKGQSCKNDDGVWVGSRIDPLIGIIEMINADGAFLSEKGGKSAISGSPFIGLCVIVSFIQL